VSRRFQAGAQRRTEVELTREPVPHRLFD
jgi:hypothetical protein